MRSKDRGAGAALAALVFAHLAVAVVHGQAHQGAAVALTLAGNLFVLLVIIVGPVAGFVWRWFGNRRGGDWLIAVTMAGSLVFGVVNHFLVKSPDQVSQVDPAWRGLFGVTAVLLAVTEVLGAGVGAWLALRSDSRSS
jgi:hypothetical protein